MQAEVGWLNWCSVWWWCSMGMWCVVWYGVVRQGEMSSDDSRLPSLRLCVVCAGRSNIRGNEFVLYDMGADPNENRKNKKKNNMMLLRYARSFAPLPT